MAELNELLEEAAVKSAALADEIEDTEAGIRSLIDRAGQVWETISQGSGPAREHLNTLKERLESAQGELEKARSEAEGRLDGLGARSVALKQDVDELLEKIRTGLGELQTRETELRDAIQGRLQTTEQDFQELAQHVQEAQQAVSQQLQAAGQAITDFREAVSAAQTDVVAKQDAWTTAMDELEQAASEETQKWVAGLEQLLANQTTAMVEMANKTIDTHNTAMDELKARFTEQAGLQVAASIEPLRDALEALANSGGARKGELEAKTRESMQRLRELLPVLDELKTVFESSGKLA